MGSPSYAPQDELALAFCKARHEGQYRKYTLVPYWLHCLEVAELVATVHSSHNLYRAALLHDTVEDTNTSSGEIQDLFGKTVAQLVWEVTDASVLSDGNRAERKAIDREHLAKASEEAQTIKLADLISNTQSIVTFDPKFAKVYLEEKRLLLEVMTKGNPVLRKMATAIVEGESCLGI